MQVVYDACGGITKASEIVGISLETLGHWRSGVSRPPLFPLAALCQAAGRSLDWLATGQELAAGAAAPASAPAHEPALPLLFGVVDIGRLDEAFRDALTRCGIRPSDLGDTNALILLTILLHDAEVKAAQASKSPIGHAKREHLEAG